MKKSRSWVVKSLGISKKALEVYEEKGYIESIKIQDYHYIKHFYEEEDIKRAWIINLFVKLGFSFKEIEEFTANENIFIESINDKIKDLTKKKSEIEDLLGISKMIACSGSMPIFPNNIEEVNIKEFLSKLAKDFNLNNSEVKLVADSSKKLQQIASGDLVEESSKEKCEKAFESFANLGSDVLLESFKRYRFQFKLASLLHNGANSKEVQDVVYELYLHEKEFNKDEDIDYTPELFAIAKQIEFNDSQIAVMNRLTMGDELCDFILEAFKIFEKSYK